MVNQDDYQNKTYNKTLRGDMAGSRASKGLKDQPLPDKKAPIDGANTVNPFTAMIPGEPLLNEERDNPVVAAPAEDPVTLDSRPRLHGYLIRKVRFHKRLDLDTPYVKFTIFYKHLPTEFTLYDGEVYDLGEDVIRHLQSIKERDVITHENGQRQNVERNFYYFEFLD